MDNKDKENVSFLIRYAILLPRDVAKYPKMWSKVIYLTQKNIVYGKSDIFPEEKITVSKSKEN